MAHPTPKPPFTLRSATPDDIPTLCAIGKSAVSKFGSIPELAHLVGASEDAAMLKKVENSLSRGRIFLAESSSEPRAAAGFLGAFQMDSTLYISEISVHPSFGGQGVGGMLLDAVLEWARERAREKGEPTARASLTAYAEVPWNGPWYERRGFREVDAATLGPEHVEKMRYDRDERDLNRPGYHRYCMLWEERIDAA
ncbi:unnamed protein product [Zymoseptoria tritici ST99CH_1E4]|uniref:N-acetyltransferase domain-containing protein n=1 Tax=Zymoseptoria tritici ST99CH_1E4 TaxID=1276532 RepID=A0A2H1GBS4_ZYMTR|nr:unnamed protein product [Zymoseptoria tritici ST99CH_1E4]